MSETMKRGRGRPRTTPKDGQRYSISTNVAAETRKKLEIAADRNGQSIAKEADDRIRQSLLDDEYLGDALTAQTLRNLSRMIFTIEQAYGKKWSEDSVVAMAVEAAVVASVGTIIRGMSLDDIGRLAFLDEDDLAKQRLEADALKEVRERSKIYNEAIAFGLSVAAGAAQNRK